MVGRDFAPGFEVRLQQKDLRLALETADRLRRPLTGTSLVHQLSAAVERMSGLDVGTQALVLWGWAAADLRPRALRVVRLLLGKIVNN